MPTLRVTLPLLALGLVACKAPVTHVHLDRDGTPEKAPGQFMVTGTAELQVRPDVADLHLTISSEAPRARAAAAQLKTRQAEMRKALQDAGIAAEDLSFSTIGIEPMYTYSENSPPRLRGYRAAMSLTATTKSFEALPDLLEAAAAAGATDVSTEKRVLDLPARKREVRDLALAAAKAKAEQTASALGVKLGRITTITEQSGDAWGWNGRWNELPNAANVAQTVVRAPSAGPTLSGDAQTLTLSIAIAYEL